MLYTHKKKMKMEKMAQVHLHYTHTQPRIHKVDQKNERMKEWEFPHFFRRNGEHLGFLSTDYMACCLRPYMPLFFVNNSIRLVFFFQSNSLDITEASKWQIYVNKFKVRHVKWKVNPIITMNKAYFIWNAYKSKGNVNGFKWKNGVK